MSKNNLFLTHSPTIIKYRWLILLISCVITFGNYFCYDIPSVLYEELSEYFKELDFFDLEFNMLYILYSIPNILTPLFGGYLIDTCGQRTMIIFFSAAVFCGQFIVSMGCTLKDFNMILFGRFVFGLGGESLMVSIVTLLTSWFEGKELAFSLGLMLSFARLGSAGNAWISPSIAIAKGVSIVFWFGSLLCFFAFISTLFVVVLDQVLKNPFEHEELTDGEMIYEEHLESDDSSTSNPTTSSTPSDIILDDETTHNTFVNTLIGKMPLNELPPLKFTEFPGPHDGLPSSSSSVRTSPLLHSAISHHNHHNQHYNIHFSDDIESHYENNNIHTANNNNNNNNINYNMYDSNDSSNDTNSHTHTIHTHFIEDTLPTQEENLEEETLQQNEEEIIAENNSPREYFTLEDLQSRKKPLWPPQKNISFWLVICCCCSIYGTIIPFITISNEVIRVAYYGRQSEKHEIAVEFLVTRLQGSLFFLAAVLAPMMGITIDYIGYRPAFIVLSSTLLFIAHFLMMFAIGSPLIPLLFVGTAYSLFSAVIWPIVPMIVDVYLQGIAFGLMTSFQNLAQCAIPTLVSYILMINEETLYNSTHETSKIPSTTMMIGISQCEFLFSILSIFGIVTGSILWYLDEYPQNNTPRGVLRATTKFSFEEIQKRHQFPPNTPNHHHQQQQQQQQTFSQSSSSSSTTTSTTSSTSSVSNSSSLYHSRHDIETPTLISNTYQNNQLNDLDSESGHNYKYNKYYGSNDYHYNEDDGMDRIHYPQPDRSDWILYDPTNDHMIGSNNNNNNNNNTNIDDGYAPVTEMTPLITKHSSSLLRGRESRSGSEPIIPSSSSSLLSSSSTSSKDSSIPTSQSGLFPTTRIMPRRSSSILRHHSVYSPSAPGPHGPYHIHKSISFTGNEHPERKEGQGQHPPIPITRRNTFNYFTRVRPRF